MSDSDDLRSYSESFFSNTEEERIDAELERKHLGEDLRAGGLEDLAAEAEGAVDSDDDGENGAREGAAAFGTGQNHFSQLNRLGGREMNQVAQQKMKDTLAAVLADFDEEEENNAPTSARCSRREMLARRKENQRKMAEVSQTKTSNYEQQIKELQKKIQMQNAQIQKLKNQNQQESNQLLDSGVVANNVYNIDEELKNNVENELSHGSFVQQNQEEVKISESSPAYQLFTAFEASKEKEQPAQSYQNLSIENETKDVSLFNEVTTKPLQLSATGTSVMMFLLDCEELGGGSAALWGKVLTYANQAEIKQGYDWYKSKLQSGVIIVHGLEKQFYLQLANSEQYFRPLQGTWDGYSKLFAKSGKIEYDNKIAVKYTDGPLPDDLYQDKNAAEQLLQQAKQKLVQQLGIYSQQIKLSYCLRCYCFDDPDIPREPQVWVRLRIAGKFESKTNEEILRIVGNQFKRAFGSSISQLDLFLAERKIKGCTWICANGVKVDSYKNRFEAFKNGIANKSRRQLARETNSYSTCFHELELDLLKNNNASIQLPEREYPPPALSVLTIGVRNYPDGSKGVEVPAAITLTYLQREGLNTFIPGREAQTTNVVIMRSVGNAPAPGAQNLRIPIGELGFENIKTSVNVVVEPARDAFSLVSRVTQLIQDWDPDIVIGHGLYALSQHICNSYNNLPTKILQNELFVCSRVTQNYIRQQTDASRAAQILFRGRIATDLQNAIVEFSQDTKETSLAYCVSVLSNEDNLIITPAVDLPLLLKNTQHTRNKLIPELLREQFAALYVQKQLMYVPLMAQLAKLTYTPLGTIMRIGRARRVENLLMTTFANLPYILPDRKEDLQQHEKYQGGLVIDPVPGLQDSLVIVLDFNSLYPSIIREYNICFTTVPPPPKEEKENENVDQNENEIENEEMQFVPIGNDIKNVTDRYKNFIFSCQLPRVIGFLVEQRQQVKDNIKKINVKLQTDRKNKELHDQLASAEIQQLALKLCANSMYGSLGYSRGRFFCPHVAASIPAQGRLELNNAVSIAKSEGYTVLYGDTDSIMIDSKIKFPELSKSIHSTGNSQSRRDIDKLLKQAEGVANKIAEKIQVGKQFLRMGLDYVFVRQLLLQKKKYAALKLDNTNGCVILDQRGIDTVRRDWCPLSRELGKAVLESLLWGGVGEGVDETIKAIQALGLRFRQPSCKIQLKYFKLTKSITQPLKQYKESANDQAHVIIAKKLEQQGKVIRPGTVIEYLIINKKQCPKLGLDPEASVQKRAAEFNYVQRQCGNLDPIEIVDIEYYIKQQIIPPIERIIAPIEQMSRSVLYEAFELEAPEVPNVTYSNNKLFDDDLRSQYEGCACLSYQCKCGALRSWPETENLQLGQPVPLANLDTPSMAHRGKTSKTPFLALEDLKTLPCQCQFNYSLLLQALMRQIKYYISLEQMQILSCSNNNCVYHINSNTLNRLVRGVAGEFDLHKLLIAERIKQSTTQSNSQQLDQQKIQPIYCSAATACIPKQKCPAVDCVGELVQIYTRRQLIKQILLLQDIINVKGPFMVDHFQDQDLIDIYNAVVNTTECMKIGTVQVKDIIRKHFGQK